MDLTWIAHPRAMFRLMGLYPPDRAGAYARDVREAARSFRHMSRSEHRGITELRLRIATARSGESLAALSRRTENAWSLEQTAVANALSVEDRLERGQPVKIAVEVPYRR
jgi:predicted Zn-dependent protease